MIDNSSMLFIIGQTIITLEEYEKLPIGATLWPNPIDNKEWYWIRTEDGYIVSDQRSVGARPSSYITGFHRTIRSMP